MNQEIPESSTDFDIPRILRTPRPPDKDLSSDEAEIMAAISDGGLSLNNLSDEDLRNLATKFGGDFVEREIMKQVTLVSAREKTSQPKPLWRNKWIIGLAAMVVAAVLTWVATRTDSSVAPRQVVTNPGTAPSRGVEVPGVEEPPLEFSGRFANLGHPWSWRSEQNTDLPDFNRSASNELMGADSERRRLVSDLISKTVIINCSGRSIGSGAIVDAKGWIITNYHVVADAVQAAVLRGESASVEIIRAEFSNGRATRIPGSLRATVYRVVPLHDLALLRIRPEDVPQGGLTAFTLGELPIATDDIFVVGSRGQGPPWAIRPGSVEQVLSFPGDTWSVVTGGDNPTRLVHRISVDVVSSNCPVGPGDSGGPMVDSKGRLVALTFAQKPQAAGGSGGYHIAVNAIASLLKQLPSNPDVYPPDLWTAADGSAQMYEPRIITNPDVANELALVIPFGRSTGSQETQAIAVACFLGGESQKAAPNLGSAAVAARLPCGLWGVPDGASFRFRSFVLLRTDGTRLVGWTDDSGNIAEIRLSTGSGNKASLIWVRDAANGVWRVDRPSSAVPLLDRKKVSAADERTIRTMIAQAQEAGEDHVGSINTPSDGSSHGPVNKVNKAN